MPKERLGNPNTQIFIAHPPQNNHNIHNAKVGISKLLQFFFFFEFPILQTKVPGWNWSLGIFKFSSKFKLVFLGEIADLFSGKAQPSPFSHTLIYMKPQFIITVVWNNYLMIFWPKMSFFTSQKVGNPVQIIKYV